MGPGLDAPYNPAASHPDVRLGYTGKFWSPHGASTVIPTLGLRSTYVGLPPGKVDEYIHGGNRTFVELSTFASGSNVPSSMDMKPYEAA